MIFETKRFIIRHLEHFDLNAFHEMQSNPEVMIYATGETKTYEEHKIELEDLIEKHKNEENTFRIWSIISKVDDTFVGTCALVTEGETHELGIRFLQKYWNKGYGHETITGLIKYAVEELQLPSLIAFVDFRNKGSLALMEKSVLEFEKQYWNEDDECEEVIYSKTF